MEVPLSLRALSGIPGQPLLTALPGAFVAVHVRQLLTPAQACHPREVHLIYSRDRCSNLLSIGLSAWTCSHMSRGLGVTDGLPRHAGVMCPALREFIFRCSALRMSPSLDVSPEYQARVVLTRDLLHQQAAALPALSAAAPAAAAGLDGLTLRGEANQASVLLGDIQVW